MKRINISSGTPWEPLRGYSRAVQVGESIFVSGTTALGNDGVTGGDSPYLQTKFVIERIRAVLTKRGFSLSDVVRTRLFVTDLSRWDDYALAHREFFAEIRPASSIVEVSRLVDPRMLVEIEVDAIRGATTVEVDSIG